QLLTGDQVLLGARSTATATEEALAVAAATTLTGGLVALVLEVEGRGVGEVGDFDDQVADVIHAGERVLRQVFIGRDGDDAFVDRVTQLHRAAADVRQDRRQRLGEANVTQTGGDRRIAIDAGGFEGAPVDEDVRPG